MNTPGNKPTSAERTKQLGLLFAQSEQKFLFAFLLVALLGVAIWSWRHSMRLDQLIDIDRRSSQKANFQIDLNRSTWMEISTLPGIGDQLAHDIVEHRQTVGAFPDNESIQSVSGIGPHTYARIAPFLTTNSSDAGSMAASSSAASRR